jgi:CHAT domain-containing protein/tetratricopeptide (TPR) repeat protein
MPVRRRAGRRASRWAAALAAAVPSLCVALAAPSSSGDAADGVQQRLAEARAAQERGSSREAQKLYESLLPDLAPRGPPADLAAALFALSQLASAQGEYDRASARGREAAEAYRELGDRAGESRALNSIAQAEVYRGDFQQALAHLDQALALARAVGDLEAEVEQLDNTGSAFFLQARYLDALRAYRAAEERVERAAGAAWQARRRRLTLSNLAALFQRLGAYDEALDLYRALQASPEALGASEQARAMINLGVLYRRLEDPLKALETYSAAQRLFARDQHRDGEIKVLKNIGIVQALDLGDLSAALDAFTRALALAEQNDDRREAMQARLYRGETLLRLGDLELATRELEGALRAAKELGTAEEQWKALYALGRVARKSGRDDLAAARFRDAIATIESVRATLQLSALKTDFLADKRDVYDALVDLLALRPTPDAAEVFELLERSRARTFQDRVQQRADGRDATPARLEAVQARLDPLTVLVEYWVTPAAAAAVWTTRDASGIVRLPVPAGATDDVSSFAKEVSAGTGEAWRHTSRLLGERLLSGVAPLQRPELRHMVVVPDGALNAVPFEALELPGGDGALLVERFDVSYVPSASILLRDAPSARSSWSFPWSRHLLAFGDPVVSEASAGALPEALGGDLRGRLPASADEVRAIAAMGDGRTEIHLGPANRKRYLLQGQARGVPLLHLSTHATSDDVSPERSRILFSPESEDRPADYLFLKEVYDLDLRGVDLATLSACDTERGKVLRGEGLQAFSRALLSAGARAAVTTLWRVADRPTAEFMKQFYFELGQREPKAQALRLAKLRFLRSASELRHPRFWAAFVLNGDGTRPVPRVCAWDRLLVLLAVVLLAAAALVGRRRSVTRPGAG